MSDIDLSAAIDAVLTELGFGPAEGGALAIDWYRSGDSEKADAVAIGGDRNLIGVILDAALPKIEAAVREQIEAAVEADAASIAKAAEDWRASEQHPVNSPAASRYDRTNAEVREAMAKHLRTVTIPKHVRGEQP